jgi:hypothetical protein
MEEKALVKFDKNLSDVVFGISLGEGKTFANDNFLLLIFIRN